MLMLCVSLTCLIMSGEASITSASQILGRQIVVKMLVKARVHNGFIFVLCLWYYMSKSSYPLYIDSSLLYEMANFLDIQCVDRYFESPYQD